MISAEFFYNEEHRLNGFRIEGHAGYADSGYDIICSGKGSNEEKSYNKEIIYNDKKFQLTCNPHTKLYNKRTDQRIYFCWGRDEIENHRIIVVRIGDHWDE